MGMYMESWPQRHRITVHDYHRLAEIGVLAPEARVELIEGVIIDMAPIGKDHQSVVDQLNRALIWRLTITRSYARKAPFA